MATVPPCVDASAIDRWDELHDVLASQERRMLIYSLSNAPKEQRLPLPDAAMTQQTALDQKK